MLNYSKCDMCAHYQTCKYRETYEKAVNGWTSENDEGLKRAAVDYLKYTANNGKDIWAGYQAGEMDADVRIDITCPYIIRLTEQEIEQRNERGDIDGRKLC